MRQIVIEIKDVGGCIVSAKTIKWIRAVAVCLSFGPNLAHVDDAYLKIIVALALSAPDDVVLDAKVILDKCADRITCCEQDCILVAASRMCIPRKSANDLLRRFVSKMNERFPGYDEHITTGKCHRFDIPLQFFSAQLTYDIEPDYAQKLLDLDFRGGHLGTDSAINDRTFKFAGFLIDASAKFKIKLPDLNIESFQTLALMILCGTMHKYKRFYDTSERILEARYSMGHVRNSESVYRLQGSGDSGVNGTNYIKADYGYGVPSRCNISDNAYAGTLRMVRQEPLYCMFLDRASKRHFKRSKHKCGTIRWTN